MRLRPPKEPSPPALPSDEVNPTGVYLGRYLDRATMRAGRELYAPGGHILVFGKTGSGKGTRFLIQNLLRIRDRSLIVVDPKGELAATTAWFRKSLGDVDLINPFGVLGMKGRTINPVADLDPDADTYIILPVERMRTHKAFLRLLVVTALRRLYRPGGLPVLFMIDEAAALGHLAPVEEAFGLARGFGIDLMLVFQDLPQLRAAYGDKADSLLANAGLIIGLPPNDEVTAAWMAARCGDNTAVAKSFQEGDNFNPGGAGNSQGVSHSQQKLIWPAGTSKSIPFFAPPYWADPAVKHLAEPNPYHEQRGRPWPARDE